MRFSRYIGKRIFCIRNLENLSIPPKKQACPKLGKPAENDFAPSQLGKGLRKSDWLKPNLGKAAGKLVG